MIFRVGRILSRTTDIVAMIAGGIVTLMMVQVFVDVVFRYIFNNPLPATTIFISHYYMMFVVFLPLAVPERDNGHISVELLTEHLPRGAQRHLARWVDLFSAGIYAAMGWAAWGEALAKHRTQATLIESDLTLPIWPGYFVVPAGSLLMVVVLLYRFFAHISHSRDGFRSIVLKDAPEDAEEVSS